MNDYTPGLEAQRKSLEAYLERREDERLETIIQRNVEVMYENQQLDQENIIRGEE